MTNSKEKFEAAYKILLDETTSREKFEHIRTLVGGLNPKVDKTLEKCSKALSNIEDFSEGDAVELSAENLPENSEKEKNRKKAILFFIKNWRDLKNEVERAKNALSDGGEKSKSENVQSVGKLLASPKGIFGAVTVFAVAVVLVMVLTKDKTADNVVNVSDLPSQSVIPKIQVIDVSGKKVPLAQLKTGIGPECKTEEKEALHYHAKNGQTAKAVDGTEMPDPGGCGFGKVDEVKVEEIES